MADEQAPSESTTETTAQPATQPAVQASPKERMYTQAEHQAEVDRVVKKRLGERVEPKVETKTAEIDPDKLSKKDLKNELDSVRAEIARDRARISFEKSCLKLGVPDDAVNDLFDLHESKKPDDTRGWLESKQGKLWAKAAASPATSTQTIATPAPAVVNPAAAPSAPSSHNLPMMVNGMTDLFSLTEQQRKDLTPMGIRKALEQQASVANAEAGIPQRPKPPSQR